MDHDEQEDKNLHRPIKAGAKIVESQAQRCDQCGSTPAGQVRPDGGKVPQVMNGYEERARQMKALQLTSVLRSIGATHQDWLDGNIDWELTARAAGVNYPSPSTVILVGSMLQAAEGDTLADPFEGL